MHIGRKRDPVSANSYRECMDTTRPPTSTLPWSKFGANPKSVIIVLIRVGVGGWRVYAGVSERIAKSQFSLQGVQLSTVKCDSTDAGESINHLLHSGVGRAHLDLTKSLYMVVLQKSIPEQIRQLILHISNDEEKVDGFVRELAKRPYKQFLWDKP